MNQEYFNRVYEKTYRRLLRYAILHLSDPTDAEDVLQNVYIAFYRRVEQRGHFDILMPQSFLLRMLRNEIKHRYAERAKQTAYPIEDYEETLSDSASFEELALDRAMVDEVLAIAKTLPSESYRIFVLYYGFELSVSEIAEELEIGREAVKSRLFRARNVIRGRLGSKEERRQA